MQKVLKAVLLTVVPLALVLGVAYGLAKIQVIPTQKMGKKNPVLGRVLRVAGLYKTPDDLKKAALAAAPPAPANTLSPEQQALKAQRDALDQERAAFESQKQAQQQAAEKARMAAVLSQPDPRELARMAGIYEQMPTDSVVKVFAKLGDSQTIALLRRMDEKKVGEVLAAIPPERAAFFTAQLSRSAPSLPGMKTASVDP